MLPHLKSTQRRGIQFSTIPTAEDVPVVFPQPTDNRFLFNPKFLGEFLSLRFGELFSIPTSIIRFHNIYGPRMGYRHVYLTLLKRQQITRKIS